MGAGDSTEPPTPPGPLIRPVIRPRFRLLGILLLAGAFQGGFRTLATEKVGILQTGSQPGHYLAWHGKPILLIGDSVTQGWMECGTNFNQTAYVDALAARGLNLVMLWAYKGTSAELQRKDARLGYDAPELWPWAGSPDDRSFDLRRFNAAYFERLKQLVAYAESRNIVVLITVHDGWTKTCFGGHPFNRDLGNGPLRDRRQYVELSDYDREMPVAFDAAWDWRRQNQYFQERFCAKLIAELKPYSNVIYEMFNEGEWYDRTRRLRHEQHFLAFFRAHCTNLLLSNSDHIAGDAPHRETNLDVVTLHPRDWVGHFPVFAEGFHTAPPKPYLYSEPVPEFSGETPSLDDVRRSVWETALAGAGWVNQNDASFGWDPRTAIAGRAAARDRAYDVAGHCARFFNEPGVQFWEMAPLGKLSSTGVCLAHVGHEYVVYTATGGEFKVDLSAVPKSRFEVRWYDPRIGKFQTAAEVASGNADATFTPPFEGDAVLHLKRVESPKAASVFPGQSWEVKAPEEVADTAPRAAATGPLRVLTKNPRYFTDGSGKAIYLTGAHDGWELQDFAWGDTVKEKPFDWTGFLDFLSRDHHNVFRLWSVEHTKINDNDEDLTSPMAYRRVPGQGKANDGGDKFDLDQFNPAYFERLRSRTIGARDRGIYVIVMLFQGWSIEDKGGKVNPWPSHPFHAGNNVNGVNGDLDGDGRGRELHTWLGANHPFTKRQRDYVRKVIDTVNDLDNVLYEIANESHADSFEWQNHMVEFIHQYERTKPKRHPVGITVPYGGSGRSGLNRELFRGPADWISPNRGAPGGFDYRDNPPPADGRKLVLTDSDHLYGNRLRDYRWVWKSFCRGHNVLFMDRWTEEPGDPLREQVRKALGHTRRFADKMDLASMLPRPDLASSKYCLASPGREYLVYLPAGGAVTVNLSARRARYAVEWFNPRTAQDISASAAAGSGSFELKAPFSGDAVLHLVRLPAPPRGE